MKYCTDCKHFSGRHHWWPFDMCEHKETRDLTGRYQTASIARHDKCGELAVFWEEKEPEPPPAPSLWQRLRATFSARATE